MTAIPIEPVSVYNPPGVKTATQFAIVNVDYKGGGTQASAQVTTPSASAEDASTV